MSEEEKETRTYFNSTDSPYVVDAKGHTLGGGERGEFEESPKIRYGVERGILVDVDELEEFEASKAELAEQTEQKQSEGDSNEGPSSQGKDQVQQNRAGSKSGTKKSQEK